MTIGPSQPRQEPRKWTVMVWSASDNDLYECCVNDVDKMERGCRPDVHVLAQVDHGANPDPAGPKTMQRLELTQNSQPLLNSPVRKDFGAGDTAAPKNLADFVQWGIKNYPAENYWLVISDHGDAWRGACRDDSHGTWMSLPQIQEALQEARQATGRKLDLLSFDCCHMASSEVAHQLQAESSFLLGSQEVMGYIGLPYDTLLPKIAQRDPRQVAELLVQESKAHPEDIPTFSAMDLSQVPAFSESMRDLGEAILKSPLTSADLRGAVDSAQCFDGGYYRDVVDLAVKLGQASPDLAEPAQRVEQAVGKLMVVEQHASSHPQAHGIQIEVQPDSEEIRQARYNRGSELRGQSWRTGQASYAETAFAKDTGWDQVIALIAAGG